MLSLGLGLTLVNETCVAAIIECIEIRNVVSACILH